ncbi:hypothetical protein Tco_0508630 [Tanacetum coccineum]
MANFATKYSIITQEMVDSFWDNFYISAEVHPDALGHGKTITQFPVSKVEMGLFDFIKTADPRKVQAVEVQKGDDQVTLLESTRHCFMPLVIPAAGGSSSAAAAEVSAPTEEGQEDVALEEAYLELADPDEGTTTVRQSEEDVVKEQPKKVKKKRLLKQSDVLPAKKLRVDHPTLVSGTGGKTLAGLEQIRLADSRLPDREQLAFHSVAPSSQESKGFLDSSAQTNLRIHTTVESSCTLGIPVDTTATAITSTRATVTNFAMDVNPDLAGPSQPEGSEGSDDSFYEPPTLDPSETKRWGSAASVSWAEVRSRTEHELELKENLRAKYAARVSSLSGEKSALTAEVSVLKMTVTQNDHDISLLDSRAACLASTLDDAKVACAEAGDKITSLASERDRLASEVSSLHVDFQDFKEKMKIQQCLLTHGIQLAFLKCLKSLEYQGTLGHALGRAVKFGMQEGLGAGYEHEAAGRNLFVVDAYNLEATKASYIDAVKALEDVDFPLVNLLKSKKDAEMDELLDCFLLDGPLAGLPEAAYLQPCIEQLSILIYHEGDKTVVGETSLSFALMNVYTRVAEARKHAAALRQLMMKIVSAPLSS